MDKEILVDSFYKQIQNLHEVEYGDFKRKLSLYLLRLEQGLTPTSPEVQTLINEMREFVIYSPDGNIENARAEVLDTSEKIRDLV